MDIIICNSCGGSGVKTYDIGTHVSEPVVENCNKCKGSGRLYKRQYTVTIPYLSGLNTFYEADSKIIDIIREVEKLYKNGEK